MRDYLKSIGANFRRVGSIPAKADIKKQEYFLHNELNPILEDAKIKARVVYFLDSAHFVWGAFLGSLWCFTRIFIKTPSGRSRFNVLGALNAITKELLIVANTTYITSTQVCEMLDKIKEKHTDQLTNTAPPITLVLDNAKYQRCKAVMEKAHKLGIELLFLPPYSPNLNLIERVWKFTKKTCLNSQYYPEFGLFKDRIDTFLANMHNTHKADLDSLLTLNFQIFKPKQVQQIN